MMMSGKECAGAVYCMLRGFECCMLKKNDSRAPREKQSEIKCTEPPAAAGFAAMMFRLIHYQWIEDQCGRSPNLVKLMSGS
jgi:hypothetical protein